MSQEFVHLHLHSEYSINDGLIRLQSLLNRTTSLNMSSVAITDMANLFGMVKFYQLALEIGIKPIIGTEIYLLNVNDIKKPFHLVLLCQNVHGYRNLTNLISKSYLEGQKQGKPQISYDWLTKENCCGLIALSAATIGDVGQALLANKKSIASKCLERWTNLFPDRFYLEIQRTGRPREEIYIKRVLDLAVSNNVPLVATNDVCFLHNDDFDAHEARICIQNGWLLNDKRRPKSYSEQQYLRSPSEMKNLFSDIPESLQNTVEIAKRCSLFLNLNNHFLPKFPIPNDKSVGEYLESQSKLGLEDRLNILFDTEKCGDCEKNRKIYDERLKLELNVIKQMGYSGYFLIVADFIRWAKKNDIPVGPGRGSGAGSLVAYVLKITDIDPLQYDLLFERFLNSERVSMPDFDIDFCMDGRDRVIEYVSKKYGSKSVSQIITYGTMAAKAVIRDVGRVLGYTYGYVDQVAKLIPFELGITLEKAIEIEELLETRYQNEDEVRVLIDLARKLEGVTRNVGKHAGGVVISPSLLTDFTPLYCEANGSNLVTQFDKDDIEVIGLVKFDFLGLRTLTIIDCAVKSINKQRETSGEDLLDILLIPTDDEDTYELLKSCQTTAIFQLESRGIKDLIKRLKPDCFEDIVALVALFRPGPLQSGMVDDFIARKHGLAAVSYPHPKLKTILSATYGVILYQEQVMQIAQVLAGYSLGAADILRRAMGKKKHKEMMKQRKIFIDGARKYNQVPEEQAGYIFDLMEKFAGYGFNKSHSVAYALIAYQTAWLKTHYPAEFMSSVLSADMDNTDKIVRLVEECRDMKLIVLAPDINTSSFQFVSCGDKVMYGLGAIKGVGKSAVDSIIVARNKKGPFKSFYDFCCRVDLRRANKKVLEALVKSGSMDNLGEHRAALWFNFPRAVKAAEQYLSNKACGQNDLFGINSIDEFDSKMVKSIAVEQWSESQRLDAEKETLGFYLSGHPINRYEEELGNIVTGKISELKLTCNQNIIVAGFVGSIRVMQTKRGKRMAFISIDDSSMRMEVAIFADVFEHHRALLEKDQLLIIDGEISADDYSGGFRMSATRIFNIAQARETYGKYLQIYIDSTICDDEMIEKQIFQISNALQSYHDGALPVCLQYNNSKSSVKLPLASKWRVIPNDDLLDSLRSLDVRVEIIY